MPRQFGKVDISAGWFCTSCPHKHAPLAPCPPAATWLLLHFCPDCDEPKQLYCRRHRDRHMPTGDAHHPETGPAGLDVQQLRAGETGGEA